MQSQVSREGGAIQKLVGSGLFRGGTYHKAVEQHHLVSVLPLVIPYPIGSEREPGFPSRTIVACDPRLAHHMYMIGLGFGLGLGMTPSSLRATEPTFTNGGPELLLQAEIVHRGDTTNEGVLVRACAVPWFEISDHLARDPKFMFAFAQNPRKFEEFIAACFERDGFDQVTLTPQRGDLGRDIIAVRRGIGSVRILGQTKAYSVGHLVTHDDIRAMLGTLMSDQGASKGIVTTTSDFQPGILKADSQFAPFMPHRLELLDGDATLQWIKTLRHT